MSRPARWLAATLLPLGPAAIAVLRLVLPYDTTDDAAVVVRKVAAAPDTQSLVVWLGFLGMLTLVPAVLAAGRLTRPAAPRTTAAAMLLLVPAYLTLGLLVAGDAGVLFGVREHLPEPVVARLFEAVHPVAVVAGVVFVVGHVVGTVLLGVAMGISGVVPRWAAALTTVAQPLHFVAAVVLGSHPLDFVAWGCNAVGFAALAVALLRAPREDRVEARLPAVRGSASRR
ncbi:hypothetical protein ACIRSS_48365 [Amycolatopsis sp. NPDC101161]|uniref:hypothetical protein n=1 Tax=Amycolatopsis sp. NPDC101161 TaxID=3363940 RepID=UPI003820AAE3